MPFPIIQPPKKDEPEEKQDVIPKKFGHLDNLFIILKKAGR
jgi:hypothetical protein